METVNLPTVGILGNKITKRVTKRHLVDRLARHKLTRKHHCIIKTHL